MTVASLKIVLLSYSRRAFLSRENVFFQKNVLSPCTDAQKYVYYYIAVYSQGISFYSRRLT